MGRKAWGVLLFLLLTLIFTSRLQAWIASDVTYIYDELGRLVAVVDPAGDTAVYNYDAVGNLLSISRYSSSLASIIRFSPGSGPVSAPVTIYGTGFSATANQNTVSFNGVAATVISATATQLLTSVPSGATSGAISITSPAGSATSSAPFTVTGSGNGGAPSITGFTPSVGTPGTAVTISGANFETIPTNNSTKFNLYSSAVSSATSSSLVAAVPTTTSGHISVTTQAGTAISSADFFVPPSPYTATDVLLTGRIAFGETKSVAINTGNKIGLYLFEGITGKHMSLNITGRTINHSTVTIYSPDGSILNTQSFYSWQGDIFYEPKALPTTGTYTILVASLDNTTGSMNITPYDVPLDTTGTITIAGSPVTVTLTPGQNSTLTFSGSSNQKVSILTSGSTIAACDVNIKKPDGSIVGGLGPAGTGTAFMDSKTLPVTDQYTIAVDPRGAYSGSITITLYDAADVTGSITPGGSPVTATTTSPGQNALYSFSGTVGQKISLNSTGKTFSECAVSIKKPDGSSLYSQYMPPSWTGAFMDSTALPASGTYTVIVDPYNNNTGSITLALYDTTNDVTGNLTIGGSSLLVSIPTPGQNALLTFTGSAAQRVGISITGLTISNSPTMIVKKPDGTALLSTTVSANGLFETNPLPVTGAYTILFDPYAATTGSLTVALTDISDVTGTITIGGSSFTVTTTVPGQNARVTFSGTAGQKVSLGITGVTITTSDVYVYKPDGTALISLAGINYRVGTGGAFVDATTLPVTGTYTIFIDPYTTYIGNMTLTLYDAPDVTATISVGGGPVTTGTSVPGQFAKLTFTGTAAQRISLSISNITSGSGYTAVSIQKPDGSTLTSLNVLTAGTGLRGFIDATTLPVAGTYTLVVDPPGTAASSVTLTLYDAQDATGTITIGSPAVNLTINTPGQNGRLTFSGTSGQQVTTHITNNTMGHVTVKVLKADGTELTVTGSSSASFNLATLTLPATATYTVFVDPDQTNIGSMSVSITSP